MSADLPETGNATDGETGLPVAARPLRIPQRTPAASTGPTQTRSFPVPRLMLRGRLAALSCPRSPVGSSPNRPPPQDPRTPCSLPLTPPHTLGGVRGPPRPPRPLPPFPFHGGAGPPPPREGGLRLRGGRCPSSRSVRPSVPPRPVPSVGRCLWRAEGEFPGSGHIGSIQPHPPAAGRAALPPTETRQTRPWPPPTWSDSR